MTDRPEPERSCFQAISFGESRPGDPYRSVDLGHLRELRIFDRNIHEHEELGLRIFAHLAGDGVRDPDGVPSPARH